MKQVEFARPARDLPSVWPFDQGKAIAARTAASSFATPRAKEAVRLAQARSIHGVRAATVLFRIRLEGGDELARFDKRGTPGSRAAKVTVSAFESLSLPMVMSRAIVLADGMR